MYNFKFALLLAFLVPSFVLGQEKLTDGQIAKSAAEVQAFVNQGGHAASLVSGAAIVTEVTPNDQHVEAWLVVRKLGRYIMQGEYCGGGYDNLGGFNFNDVAHPPIALPIFRSQAASVAKPYGPGTCKLEVFREENGIITQLSTWLPEDRFPDGSFDVVSEGSTGATEYFVLVSGTLEKDAIAVLGRDLFASRLEPAPGGYFIFFSRPPWSQNSTITVCQSGKCVTRPLRTKTAYGGKG